MSSTNSSKSPIVSSGTHEGIEWETHSGPVGGLNGYALLPSGHPFRKLDLQFDDSDAILVHGGITYGPNEGGWVGFDTCHAGDVWPETPDIFRGMPSLIPETHWTQEKVEAQCRKMCEQIASAMKESA